MLGNKSAPPKPSGASTLIARDAAFTGTIEFTGALDIEGLVRGDVHARQGKDALVRVLAHGRVEGEIRAPSVVIDGTVEGDVYATKLLQLDSRARVEGNVYYAQAEMRTGAEVNGTFRHMGETGGADSADSAGKAAAPSGRGERPARQAKS